MLIIVNPYATTVSDRLKNLVVYALQGRYEVEAIMTEAKDHATEIGREAVDGGYEIVVAFGGDGTLNEVVNGLAGTDVPVCVLPGGSTNVVARTLGIPNDVVDATEHLLGMADDFQPRKIDLGRVNDRRFVFACGAGLDATVVQRVDANPGLKARAGQWFYTWAAISGFSREYLHDPVKIRSTTVQGSSEGVTTLIQNSDPYTYFGPSPIHVCRAAALDNGTLSVASLKRAALWDMPTVMARLLYPKFDATRHRQIDSYDGVIAAQLESISTDDDGALRPFPVQVDGDYIGDHTSVDIAIEPQALTIVA